MFIVKFVIIWTKAPKLFNMEEVLSSDLFNGSTTMILIGIVMFFLNRYLKVRMTHYEKQLEASLKEKVLEGSFKCDFLLADGKLTGTIDFRGGEKDI